MEYEITFRLISYGEKAREIVVRTGDKETAVTIYAHQTVFRFNPKQF